MSAFTTALAAQQITRAAVEHTLAKLPLVPLPEARERPSWLRFMLWSGLLPATACPPVDPELERLFDTLPMGGWGISRDTARALSLLFEATRPVRVMEFGSGVSTVVFAALCARGGRGGRVLSIDEKPAYAERTQARLAAQGLSAAATVLSAPVAPISNAGWSGFCYVLDHLAVKAALADAPIDFIFVDGPASWSGKRGDCRSGTLLLAQTWVGEAATFVVDDALRPRDLAMLRTWQRRPDVDVRAIVPVGSGLGVGLLAGPSSGA